MFLLLRLLRATGSCFKLASKVRRREVGFGGKMLGHHWTPLAAATAVSLLVAPFAAIGAPHHANAAAAAAHDGPFGIVMGEPLADLGPTKYEGSNGVYEVLSVPRPSSVFTGVGVQAFPSTGVCLIQASKDPIDYDTTGERIKASIDDTEALVATKYGAPLKKIDDCSALPVECSTFWSLKASEGSATYEYVWDLSASKRTDGIGIVSVTAVFTSAQRAYVSVRYYSQNRSACDEASKGDRAAGL